MLICNSTAEEDAEEDDEMSGDNLPHYNKLIMPEVVISLDASDEFLKERVMNLPQTVVEGTHNTEKGMLFLYKVSMLFEVSVLYRFYETTVTLQSSEPR